MEVREVVARVVVIAGVAKCFGWMRKVPCHRMRETWKMQRIDVERIAHENPAAQPSAGPASAVMWRQ